MKELNYLSFLTAFLIMAQPNCGISLSFSFLNFALKINFTFCRLPCSGLSLRSPWNLFANISLFYGFSVTQADTFTAMFYFVSGFCSYCVYLPQNHTSYYIGSSLSRSIASQFTGTQPNTLKRLIQL